MKTQPSFAGIAFVFILIFSRECVQGQGTLFDFENASLRSSLPLSLTVNGITAQFTATGLGFSIQTASALGVVPVGFSGNCIYPDSVYASDLTVTFSVPLTNFSILYAPDELACDSSATMRATAYSNGIFVGTTTTNAQAGTWPSETLQFASPASFNRVVVHYDKPPVTGGDYGVIFAADNMYVTPAPPPVWLMNPVRLANGMFQFTFTNLPNTPCTVYETTNLNVPSYQWTVLGGVIENPPGQFQFTDTQATNDAVRYYRVSCP